MIKQCKLCSAELTQDNWIQVKRWIRSICRSCRSKKVSDTEALNPEKRRSRMNAWKRKAGIVKQYPCKTCNKLCYKKYALAFCSDECRFLSYVNKTESCWLWIGALNRRGYGRLCFRGNNTDTAHRVSYKLFKGPIENNLYVCHSCDIPACVNPGHLWLGTGEENMMDMVQKGRQSSKLTSSDVFKIRELIEKFKVARDVIKEKYNIGDGHLSNIIKRRIWKHI